MELIVCFFEQLSGFKINFQKKEVFCFGNAKDKEQVNNIIIHSFVLRLSAGGRNGARLVLSYLMTFFLYQHDGPRKYEGIIYSG
jgi:hypothetical protein